MHRMWRIIFSALCLTLLVFMSAVAQEEPAADANRVGIVVNLETPGVLLNEQELLGGLVRQIHEHLKTLVEEGKLRLAKQEDLISVQRRLKINLSQRSKPQDIKTITALLRLDRFVVLRFTISDRFKVVASATVFNQNGRRLLSTTTESVSPELNKALERSAGLLVRQLIPILR